ncbi:MAG: hypothetical protein ACFFCW_48410 [Candidatus Hodarchaeota archaeon]
MKKQNLIIIVSLAAAVVLLLGGLYILNELQKPRTFYDSGISDNEYIAITNQTMEAQKFLEKYPTTTIFVDRSGRLAVDYRVDADDGYIRLRVFINPTKNKPSEMFLDINGTYIRKNILERLQTL